MRCWLGHFCCFARSSSGASQEAYRLSSSIDESIELRPVDPDKRDDLVRLVAAVAGVKWLKAGVRDLAAGPQIVFVFAARGGL